MDRGGTPSDAMGMVGGGALCNSRGEGVFVSLRKGVSTACIAICSLSFLPWKQKDGHLFPGSSKVVPTLEAEGRGVVSPGNRLGKGGSIDFLRKWLLAIRRISGNDGA
eukprot:1161410-Pelagomonas_calceolata.AAC.14